MVARVGRVAAALDNIVYRQDHQGFLGFVGIQCRHNITAVDGTGVGGNPVARFQRIIEQWHSSGIVGGWCAFGEAIAQVACASQ